MMYYRAKQSSSCPQGESGIKYMCVSEEKGQLEDQRCMSDWLKEIAHYMRIMSSGQKVDVEIKNKK